MDQAPLFWPSDIIVDLFAGGGGASTGIEQALPGRWVTYGVNHDAAAMIVHRANHPRTMHYGGDVFDVLPKNVARGAKVKLLWASPSCTFFSQVRMQVGEMDPQVRALADVVIRWAEDVRPKVIMLENVRHFQAWGPLYPVGDPRVPRKLWGRPIKEREGEEFNRWLRELRGAGYRVETAVLNAADYGAPTDRSRFFLIARSDRERIVWPEPTHGPGRLPYLRTCDFLDWSIPFTSIFERKAPFSVARQRRIAAGFQKFGHQSLAIKGYGERPGQSPRTRSLASPFPTIVAEGVKADIVTAFVSKNYGGKVTPGQSIHAPLSTITTKNHHAITVGTRPASPARRRQTRAWLDEWVGPGRFPEVEDIGTREPTPRELFSLQGFPSDYVIDPIVGGRGITKTDQIRLCGNSVPPQMSRALVAANFPEEMAEAAE